MDDTSTSLKLWSNSISENQASKRRKVEDDENTVIKIKKDGPPSDSWSWRKYGQKLIKGFTYPRGYYRCTTTKECSARKYVDRSKEDASILIITYTSTHNHPSPSLTRTHKSPKKKAQPQAQYQIIKPNSRPISPNQEQANNKGNIENKTYDQGQEGHSPPISSPNETKKLEKQDEQEPYVVSLDNLTPYESQNSFLIVDEQSLDAFPQLKYWTTSKITQENYDIFDEIDDLKKCF